jgi:hypothetical protein
MVLDGLIEKIDIADARPDRRRVYRTTVFNKLAARAEARRPTVLVRAVLDRKLLPENPGPREKDKP